LGLLGAQKNVEVCVHAPLSNATADLNTEVAVAETLSVYRRD